MNAWPRRCSNGPQNRIGIRLDPACTLISSTLPRSTLVGSSTSSPGSSPSVTRTPWSSNRPANDLDVADRRNVVQVARPLAEQRGDHRLGDEVLRAPHPDLPAQGSVAVHDEDVVGQRNLQRWALPVRVVGQRRAPRRAASRWWRAARREASCDQGASIRSMVRRCPGPNRRIWFGTRPATSSSNAHTRCGRSMRFIVEQ